MTKEQKTMIHPGPRAGTLCCILYLSGFAGLGYETVWTRMLSAGLGHGSESVARANLCRGGDGYGSYMEGIETDAGRSLEYFGNDSLNLS